MLWQCLFLGLRTSEIREYVFYLLVSFSALNAIPCPHCRFTRAQKPWLRGAQRLTPSLPPPPLQNSPALMGNATVKLCSHWCSISRALIWLHFYIAGMDGRTGLTTIRISGLLNQFLTLPPDVCRPNQLFNQWNCLLIFSAHNLIVELVHRWSGYNEWRGKAFNPGSDHHPSHHHPPPPILYLRYMKYDVKSI